MSSLASQKQHDFGQQRHQAATKLRSFASQKDYDIGRQRRVRQLEYDIGRPPILAVLQAKTNMISGGNVIVRTPIRVVMQAKKNMIP